MLRTILFILCLFPATLWAKDKKIITSIRPLQSIIANILDGSKEVDLIITQNESLHNYQLKPNKILEIYNSDMIIIIDKNFELFMDKTLNNLGPKHKVIEVAKFPSIKLLKNKAHNHEHEHDDGESHTHSHDHNHDHSYGHCHHHLSKYDYHLWLDISIIQTIAEELTDIFAKATPSEEKQYRQNLANFIVKLNDLDTKIKAETLPAQGKNFIVTHNAYDYFINRYGLNQPEAITIDHDHNIGARDLLNLQQSIAENKIQCIFEEPQFDSQIMDKLKEGTKVKIGKLDAEWGPDNVDIKDVYFDMMESLAKSFHECLN